MAIARLVSSTWEGLLVVWSWCWDFAHIIRLVHVLRFGRVEATHTGRCKRKVDEDDDDDMGNFYNKQVRVSGTHNAVVNI